MANYEIVKTMIDIEQACRPMGNPEKDLQVLVQTNGIWYNLKQISLTFKSNKK